MDFCIRKPRDSRVGYYVDTVGKNTKAIKEYIANKLEADRKNNELALFDSRDHFKE